MNLTARITVVALLATLVASPAFAEDKEKKKGKRRRGGGQVTAFSPAVTKAVPGIHALVKLSKEQRQQLAALRKDSNLGELRKKTRGKDLSKEDRKAARQAVQDAEASLAAKANEIIGKDHAALVAKINATVKEVQTSLRSEYKQKFKDSKGDKEARKTLQKEMAAKSQAMLAEKIGSLLTAEQKEAIKAASEKRGKKGKSEKRKKKDGEAKEGKKKGKKKKDKAEKKA